MLLKESSFWQYIVAIFSEVSEDEFVTRTPVKSDNVINTFPDIWQTVRKRM